jgi:hypothetical protein
MKTMAIYLAKKYAIGFVRSAVTAKKDKVSYWAKKVQTAAVKAEAVLMFLKVLAARLTDGELTQKALATEIVK